MSRYNFQFKITPGNIRVEEQTETINEAELGFILAKPGKSLSTEREGMPERKFKIKVENFTLNCSWYNARRLVKNRDGTVVLSLDRFGVWKHPDVSILLESVEERVIQQAFHDMATAMSSDSASDSASDIPETAIDLLCPETAVDLLCPEQSSTAPLETPYRARFWIKDKKETKRIVSVEDHADIFFNVEGIDHVPHCKLKVHVEGFTLQMKNVARACNGYVNEDKILGVAEFGWFSKGRPACLIGDVQMRKITDLRASFDDKTIRKAFILMGKSLIEHEEEKRAKGKRQGLPPNGAEEMSLADIEQELAIGDCPTTD